MKPIDELTSQERWEVLAFIKSHHNNPSSRYFGFWKELFKNVQLDN